MSSYEARTREAKQVKSFEAFIQSIESNSSNPFDDVRKEGKALGLETEKLAFSNHTKIASMRAR